MDLFFFFIVLDRDVIDRFSFNRFLFFILHLADILCTPYSDLEI